MYFKGYDANSHSVTGVHFMVLTDGDKSKDKTPAFEVSLYLMSVGKSSLEDLIIIKTYQLDGIFHMGSHEFKNETIALAGISIPPGNYRLGIWVNSNEAFTENTNDNATLFNGSMNITGTSASSPSSDKKKELEKKKTEEEEWSIWEEDDNIEE